MSFDRTILSNLTLLPFRGHDCGHAVRGGDFRDGQVWQFEGAAGGRSYARHDWIVRAETRLVEVPQQRRRNRRARLLLVSLGEVSDGIFTLKRSRVLEPKFLEQGNDFGAGLRCLQGQNWPALSGQARGHESRAAWLSEEPPDATINLHLIHLPLHASWLNQVEVFFSILQRKVLTPNDSASLIELGERILAFQDGRLRGKRDPVRMEIHASGSQQPVGTAHAIKRKRRLKIRD